MTSYTAAYSVEVADQYGRAVTTINEVGSKPLDKDGADKLAEILRGGFGDHQVTVTTARPTPLQVWGIVLDLIATQGLPAPVKVEVREYHVAEIQLPRNERGQVDAWLNALGITAAAKVGKPDYSYTTYAAESDGDCLLPKWRVEVSCGIDTAKSASVHGSDFTSPDVAEYAAWKAARDAELAALSAAETPADVAATPAVVAKKAAAKVAVRA